MLMLGIAMLLPAAAEGLQRRDDALDFVVCAAIPATFGTMLVLKNWAIEIRLGRQGAYVLTSLSWIVLPVFGAMPFMWTDMHLGFVDAYFETVSGLTTTGATVIVGLDDAPAGILLWRSVLHWVGGIGIILMAVAILPFLRVGGMQILKQESSDTSDKMLARPRQTANWLVGVYGLLTLLCMIGFIAAGMNPFEALNHALATVSTGGFSTSDSSFGAFSPAAQWVCIPFMIAGALPFMLYVRTLRGSRGFVPTSQIWVLLAVIAASALALAAYLVLTSGMPALDALRHALFNVVSIVTTTGFASTDYQLWGPFAGGVILLLSVCGGCTGSTTGGVKIFRWQLLFAEMRHMTRRLARPHVVIARSYQGREVTESAILGVALFAFLYAAITAFGTVALTLTGLDLITALTATVACLGNVGPGLGEIVGPAGTFAPLPDSATALLSLAMIFGRLEMLTLLVLLEPSFWRR